GSLGVGRSLLRSCEGGPSGGDRASSFTVEIDAPCAGSQAALIDPVVDVDLQRPGQLGRRHRVAECEKHIVVDANLQRLAARLIMEKASRKLRAQQLEYGGAVASVLCDRHHGLRLRAARPSALCFAAAPNPTRPCALAALRPGPA